MATAPKKAPVAAPVPEFEPAPKVQAIAPSTAEVEKMVEAPVASLTDMQHKVRTMIEKGLSETRANYSKAKTAADEASGALEASFVSAKTGVVEINVKALEALRASADANFDFIKSIFGVKSPSDYVTLHTEFARKQMDMLTGQTKELSALAQKVATESAGPIKAQVAKTLKIAV